MKSYFSILLKLKLITLFLSVTQFLSAQRDIEPDDLGTVHISCGYGFPSFPKMKYNKIDGKINPDMHSTGPIHFKLGISFGEAFELSGTVNVVDYYGTWEQERNGVRYNYQVNHNSFNATLRFNIHFTDTDVLDIYAGAGFGMNAFSVFNSTNDPENQDFEKNYAAEFYAMEATAGIRFYVINNVGLYVEAGYAKSFIQGGIVFKLAKK